MPATRQKQINFDARKLMEQAIEVMRQSVSEARDDGKASPMVGAVLWKPDGTIEASWRGELRSGDHAEYTLLERKNRDTPLDGSVLFATLEPCAPNARNARNAPKMSCAKRIVLARIKEDLSDAALQEYRSVARIKTSLGSDDFNRRLLQQGLLKKENEQLSPTGFGLLLFGKAPRMVIPQAAMLATIHYPDGPEETKDFDGPMVLIPKQVETWLNDKLPNVIDRGAMQRKAVPSLPFEMIREAVVNALIHRDYDITGAKCQLVITVDTITVKSPGGPLPPITLKQLQAFNAPMLSRNPGLHYVFAQMEMAEERGFGLKSLKKRAKERGLPLPKYSFDNPYLVLTLYRNPQGVVNELPQAVAGELNADERAAWQFLNTREFVTSRELMAELEFDERKAQRVLKKLIDLKLLRKLGKGPATSYELVQS